MAFAIPQRQPGLLYFPTLHIHDGQIRPSAHFDHLLYCQAEDSDIPYLAEWERSISPAEEFMGTNLTKGIVLPDRHCWRMRLSGLLENRDALVGQKGALPVAARIRN
jgi:hypothetical protein